MAGNQVWRMDAHTDRRTDARTLIHVNIRTEGQGKNILPRSGAEAGHKNKVISK